MNEDVARRVRECVNDWTIEIMNDCECELMLAWESKNSRMLFDIGISLYSCHTLVVSARTFPRVSSHTSKHILTFSNTPTHNRLPHSSHIPASINTVPGLLSRSLTWMFATEWKLQDEVPECQPGLVWRILHPLKKKTWHWIFPLLYIILSSTQSHAQSHIQSHVQSHAQ